MTPNYRTVVINLLSDGASSKNCNTRLSRITQERMPNVVSCVTFFLPLFFSKIAASKLVINDQISRLSSTQCLLDPPQSGVLLDSLPLVTPVEVLIFLQSCPNKSSPMDYIPPFLSSQPANQSFRILSAGWVIYHLKFDSLETSLRVSTTVLAWLFSYLTDRQQSLSLVLQMNSRKHRKSSVLTSWSSAI